ncbi:hypothetical protein NE865_03117 [Phthorimaea operculella]|nr:hypothetical protein NE865_03117 [Phthorimaea operculella]
MASLCGGEVNQVNFGFGFLIEANVVAVQIGGKEFENERMFQCCEFRLFPIPALLKYPEYLIPVILKLTKKRRHRLLVRTLREDGTECVPGEVGRLVAKLPLPPGFASTLWQSDERFKKTYFDSYPGYYDTQDAGWISAEGAVWVVARADDVINVAGHRLSTAALEDVVLKHARVADAVVVGAPDPTKGDVPLCLYVMRPPQDALEDVVLKHARVADAVVVGAPDPTKGDVPLCLYVMRPPQDGECFITTTLITGGLPLCWRTWCSSTRASQTRSSYARPTPPRATCRSVST